MTTTSTFPSCHGAELFDNAGGWDWSGAATGPEHPPEEEIPEGVPDMYIVINGKGVFALFGSVAFKFKDWTSYTESVTGSTGAAGAAHRRRRGRRCPGSWLYRQAAPTDRSSHGGKLMLNVIWTSPNSAEILFLVAAIVAFVYAVLVVLNRDVIDALVPVAICLIALGLLAI